MGSGPMFGRDPEAVTRMLDDITAQARQRHQQFAMVRQKIEAVTVTERSPDGVVRATVNSGGALTGLALTDRARQLSPNEIAARVLACVQRAQARIAERVRDIVAETVPGDDPAAAKIVAGFRGRFPEPPADAGTRTEPAAEIRLGELAQEPPAPPKPAPRRQGAPSDDGDDDWAHRSFLR
ncbi:YbaB/EbfC family nucleoid-associated protein [Gandjariella thermophila]|uniref:YbaB/EbfC DNA-binding family protein n=1 Tax=Gandjariella thermophila TaxID=1931992 RepID=A0A4D4JAF2_9PSEU|nr:YbaB/EbfC family nucleoid-associated protein [Gandjariella thermophila]GDY32302.1 hypothetical protein GTS_39350 [Gandjariella thermophila]